MILYGASGHAKVIIDILEALGTPSDFLVDDNPSISSLLGYEVRRDFCTYESAIVSIGNSHIRRQIVERLAVKHRVMLCIRMLLFRLMPQ